MRNHHHLWWNDYGEQQNTKKKLTPAKWQSSKTIPHQRAHERLSYGGNGAGHNADRQRTKVIQMFQCQNVTVGRRIARDPAHRRVAELDQRLERCGKHEQHGKQENIGQFQQDQPAQNGNKMPPDFKAYTLQVRVCKAPLPALHLTCHPRSPR